MELISSILINNLHHSQVNVSCAELQLCEVKVISLLLLRIDDCFENYYTAKNIVRLSNYFPFAFFSFSFLYDNGIAIRCSSFIIS